MEKKHRGAWAELVACGWLLKEGYEVYRNVSPHGVCDILQRSTVSISNLM